MAVMFSFVDPDDPVPFPAYETEGASGMDLRAWGDGVVNPGSRAIVSTGLRIAIPFGYEGQVRSRSGLAANNGVTVLNSPGTIDADYRGELKVILFNHGEDPFVVSRGDRIAQLVIAPVEQLAVIHEQELPPTDRGDGGFGSTGVK